MRRTLTFTVLTIIAILAVIPAQASVLSDPMDYLQGKHRTFYRAHSEVGVTLGLPIEWSDYTADCFKYWEEKDVIYAGSTIQLDILIKYGDVLRAQRFRVFVSDPLAVLKTTDKKGAKCQKELEFAGLRNEGEYYGRYARINLDTATYTPGIYFLYIATPKMDKYHLWGEESIKFVIAPPLPEMVEKLKGESDETLKKWGLESYPTLQDVVGKMDATTVSQFDIVFTDGGKMRGVSIPGSPQSGRILGVFTSDEFAGVVKVDSVENGIVRSSSDSRFLQRVCGRESELRLDWVMQAQTGIDVKACDLDKQPWKSAPFKTTVFVEPDDIVRQGKIPWLNKYNFLAYSKRSKGSGDQVDVVRKGNFAREIKVGKDGHMYVIKCGNRVWMLEVEVEQSIQHTIQSERAKEYVYVPERKAQKVRCIRLSAGGIPVIKNMVADREEVQYQGLWGGLAYIIGQRVHRPDRIDIKNTANAPTNVDIDMSQSQQQQQEQQQQQDVVIDP